MSSKAKCIVCKKELDYEISKLDYFLDEGIFYCDECFEVIAAEWEDEYEDDRT